SFSPFSLFAVSPFVRAVPHSLQNFAPLGFSTLQAAQRIASVAPHSLQNFAPSRFSCWHCGQRISLASGPRLLSALSRARRETQSKGGNYYGGTLSRWADGQESGAVDRVLS